MSRKNIIILGGGVIGLCSAYYLLRNTDIAGEITIIDRGSNIALESSYANGGQLSYGHSQPLSSLRTVLQGALWMFMRNAPLDIRFPPRAADISWLTRFVMQALPSRYKANTCAMLQLALESRAEMTSLISDNPSIAEAFSYKKDGIIHIFSSSQHMRAATRAAEILQQCGDVQAETLDHAQLLEREPGLADARIPITGGISFPQDETGDVHEFCRWMERHLQESGRVHILTGCTVEHIMTDGGKVTEMQTDKGNMHADEYIIALGAFSHPLLGDIGVRLPLAPLKGYSISLRNLAEMPLRSSVTDEHHKIVYTNLGGSLRVVGTAEFAGYDTGYHHKRGRQRIDMLKRHTARLFPSVADMLDEADEHACLRCCTPSSVPVIGRAGYDNLWINTGHGFLGWTQALGSTSRLVGMIEKGAE